MKIERIRVEGGFLDGLDLSFSAGLNVIIGGRGTGKTSIIELIRFCSGVPNFSDFSARRSREHALAILEDGQVSLTFSDGGTLAEIWRTSTSDHMSLPGKALPIIFSQSDVETLGLQAAGRLRLIDSFRSRRPHGSLEDERTMGSIGSLTSEMQQLSREIENVEGQLAAQSELEAQLKQVSQEEQALIGKSTEAKTKQRMLSAINQQTSKLAVAMAVVTRTDEQLKSFLSRVEGLITVPPEIERWPVEGGDRDRLVDVRGQLQSTIEDIRRAARSIRASIKRSEEIQQELTEERAPIERQARDLRKDVESLQEGAGTISRAASQIREKVSQLRALESLLKERRARLEKVQSERATYLNALEKTWERRFSDRVLVANYLNSQLNPRIRVRLLRSAQLSAYAGSIAAALRGSALRYGELSTSIAARMSPRELVEIVELGDDSRLAAVAEISRDRAAKVIGSLRERGTAEILTANVEDDVGLELLDGTEYKQIENLSTGQRCTVVLPIVLEHKNRVLVVDQPEDNLDNAFVVDTLIKSILNRDASRQLIFSTHNANIPVLGEADRVILMASDGRHGFVEHVGSLEDNQTVQAITTVMEGGKEAFDRRARFYEAHDVQWMRNKPKQI